jgi:hypothetical protein
MISIFPHKNLQPVVFSFNMSKSVAITHAERILNNDLHRNIGAANRVANQFFLTCYTEGGIFDENTAVIYADSYGTPLSRAAVQTWNYNSHGITAASGHYHMNIIGGENVFNTPVLANSIQKLPYIIPCYLHQELDSAAGPYGYQDITYLSYYRLTYVSVFSDQPYSSFHLSNKLSLNEFNGISLADPGSSWFNFNGSGGRMWLTPVYQGFTHSSNLNTNNMRSYRLNYNASASYSTIYNPTMKWVIPLSSGNPNASSVVRASFYWGQALPSPVGYPGLPQSQKELLYRGNGASPASAIGAPSAWYFQDNFTMFGHTSWETGHHLTGGAMGGSTYWLTRKSPIFLSSTPNAYGGNNQNNTVFPQSGWYSRAPSGGQVYYWNKRIFMFTNTKTD